MPGCLLHLLCLYIVDGRLTPPPTVVPTVPAVRNVSGKYQPLKYQPFNNPFYRKKRVVYWFMYMYECCSDYYYCSTFTSLGYKENSKTSNILQWIITNNNSLSVKAEWWKTLTCMLGLQTMRLWPTICLGWFEMQKIEITW